MYNVFSLYYVAGRAGKIMCLACTGHVPPSLSLLTAPCPDHGILVHGQHGPHLRLVQASRLISCCSFIFRGSFAHYFS